MIEVPCKPDRDQIIAFLEQLKHQGWISGTERSWWPWYVFHFTHVENAARILEEGVLYCRAYLEEKGLPFTDAASRDVIARTKGEVKNYVRLYFRPRTPTQFRNEGIRPKNQLWSESHCPVPIFLLFRSADILTRLDCEFTDGNSASSYVKKGSSAQFLENLPFDRIYHTGPYDPEIESRITFHRNAEIIIPKQLDLSALSLLACRSTAEKDTLLALLPEPVKDRLQNRIRVAPVQLHEKRWTFVERVKLEQERIVIDFSPDSETPGPFLAGFELHNLETERQAVEQIANFNVNDSNPFVIDLPLKPQHYRFRITLDGQLAYENEYSALPF